MLGKLIKYDLKAMNRFLILIHVFLLFAAVLGRFLLTNQINLSANNPELNTSSLLLTLSIMLFTFIIIGASFATYIIIAIRFYKNTYSDEGYLTHTLPVTKGQLLFSKTISGSIWAIIDTILLFVSLYIVMITPQVALAFHENKNEVLRILGFDKQISLSIFFIIFLLIIVIGCISSIVTIYASIACGQLFSSHRILGAVVSYFAFQTILSIAVTIIMAFYGYFSAASLIGASEPSNFADIMINTLEISGIMTFMILIVLYAVTYQLLKKKVNLQ